ncbi:sensor histidine kinase [Brevibacterium litoralis]|uniref:sensor histidine kinase n=1 Tax=Brevibacterium litoralis TaxID=3138935 RepID=UPI0032EAEDB0
MRDTSLQQPLDPSWRRVRTLATRAGLLVWDTVLWFVGVCMTVVWEENIPGLRSMSAGAGPSDLVILHFMFATLLWVAVYFRRRLPEITFGAGAVLALLGSDTTLVLVAMFHLFLRRGGAARIVWTVCGVLLVVQQTVRVMVQPVHTTVVGWAFEVPPGAENSFGFRLVPLFVSLIALAVVYGVGSWLLVRRSGRRAQDALAREHARRQELDERLAHERERVLLATDLHDSLGNRLSSLSVQAGHLVARLDSAGDAGGVEGGAGTPLRDEVAVMRGQAQRAMADLRVLVRRLRTESGDPRRETGGPWPDASGHPGRGVEGASTARHDPAQVGTPGLHTLGDLVAHARSAGTPVEAVLLVQDAQHGSTSFGQCVYRILQESLTNALKHAPGLPVSVYVEGGPLTGVALRVSNPVGPVSIEASPESALGSGSGLIGIRQRADFLGGTAWVGAHEGTFIVDVRLPAEAPADRPLV